MTPAEQIVAMMIADGITPERAAKYAEAIEALIAAMIEEREPKFLRTR